MSDSLSVCTIVKNEAVLLPQMLDSIRSIADEIIIADTGSTDRTVEIAEGYGARVFKYEWHDDFAAARNYAAEQATRDWIFIIDADEVLTNPENIKKYLNAPPNTLYMFKVMHISNTSDINFNSGCHSNGRIFPNKQGFEYAGAVHEHIIQTRDIEVNRVLITGSEIYHYGFSEYEESVREKFERNIRLLKIEMAKSPQDQYFYYMHFLLGKEYLGLNDFHKALQCFNKCLAMPDIDENIIINTITYILKIFSIQSNWKKVNDYCQKYAYICFKNPDFCLIYGSFLSEVLKKYNEADFYYYKALEFKAENYPFMIYDQASITWKPLLFLGLNSRQRNDYQKAAEYLEQALVFTTGIWQIQYNLLHFYLKLNNREKALDLFNLSASLFPPDVFQELQALLQIQP
jgi:glycosyltransferase involved in cell wall biosynthesis